MATLLLSKLSKTYTGGIHAVRDFSLQVADREFLVLVGPSGCGKSTLLRLIAGLESPTDGAIEIGGRLVNEVPPHQRDIAMVFQSHVLYPHMNVHDNLAFPLRMRRQPREETARRVRRVAEQLGLTDLLHRMPATLSGGQRQRIALGRALVRQPQLFLLDEPLSNLDAHLRARMRSELKQLHAKFETTTIHVTHDQEEALSLGNRVAVMSDGMLHQCGTPHEVLSRPRNRFVAEFVGSPPMSFLAGVLSRDPGGGLQFISESVRFSLIEQQQRVLERYHDQGIDVGFRPKLFSRDANPDASDSVTIDAIVASVDRVDDRLDYRLRLNTGEDVVARLDREQETVGETIRLHFPKQKIEFFSAGQPADGLSQSRNLMISEGA